MAFPLYKDEAPAPAEPTPDNLKLVAIDFYHRYKDDIKLFAEMGFKVFRTSIARSRIFPNGNDAASRRHYQSYAADHFNDLFCDIHVRGVYPNYIRRYFRKNNVEIKFADGDAELLRENTVDFVSFSYHMSICESVQDGPKGEGNLMGGIENPYLEKSDFDRYKDIIASNGANLKK